MKIIHVLRRFTTEEWGGTETVILQLCKAQQRMGHDVHIFTSMALAKRKYEEIEGVPVHRFSYCYPFWGLSEQDKRDMDRKGGNLLSLSLLFALLTEKNVDFIHLHTTKRTGGAGRTAARIRRIPYAVTLHGGVFDVPKQEMTEMLKPIEHTIEWGKLFGALLGSRRVLEDADIVICVGENELMAARRQLPHDRIACISNGVDIDFFSHGDGAAFRQKHQIPASRKLIACISRIDPQKNQLALIEAFASLLGENNDLHLLLIGPVTIEAYRDRIRERIEALALADRVTWLGGIPPGDPELANAYSAADIFCLPSRHEPFGIVILEAWASGVPVVAANVGGIPTFAEHEINALLFDPQDIGALTSALRRLLSDADLRQRLIDNARRKVVRYSWDRIAQDTLALYEQTRLAHAARGRR